MPGWGFLLADKRGGEKTLSDSTKVAAADSSQPHWDPALYDNRHSFVYHLAADLLNLLDAKSGETILDLGCGTGHLTAKIAETGARVTGFDHSAEMIAQAQRLFPNLKFEVADARDFTTDSPVDAVLSNAVLHWVMPPEAAARSIFRALQPGGRFVAEFGGRGCVRRVIEAVNAALGRSDAAERPWYFPSVGEYSAVLEGQGFEVRYMTLFDRPTPLEDGERGLANWLEMFGGSYFTALDAARKEKVVAEVASRLRPELWREGQWVADYRRLRLVAVKL